MRIHSGTEMCVEPTKEGIGTRAIHELHVGEPTEEAVEDSEFDENRDITVLEMRDFNDEDGIEEDVGDEN